MASIRKDIHTMASPEDVWEAIRDIGALHTRLVPGFVVATRLEPGARVVTFGSGAVSREPIVTLDDPGRRLVWTVEDGQATHYNASVEVSPDTHGGSLIVWLADFLPDSISGYINAAMESGGLVMKVTLDRLA
jgi:hypothetical protein